MQLEKKLEKLSIYYLENPLDRKFPEIIKSELGIEINAKYGTIPLIHPILVAPGQLTREKGQIERIKKAGYSGCILKSVVGEDEKGDCSMIEYRKKMTFLKTVYEKEDKEGTQPIIVWNGRADTRNLKEYLEFAQTVFPYQNDDFFISISILCHLPTPKEEFKKEEWIYTTKKLYEIGYKIFEIDFCPGIKNEKELIEKENVLRWYREIPGIMKNVSEEILV
ncbi:MAG: hypothetical protein NZ891_08945, partial [bacterium]|nr:hypothetical protein [bacterium]MDW8164847.1 hypothetical protein [Candidatus Omnitrophota bacterium]